MADHERPLSPRGRRAAAALAGEFRASGVSPELVVCSTALRTRQTLADVAPGFAASPATRFDPAIYGAGLETLVAALREIDDDTGSVLLLGHNPGVQDLALFLIGEDRRPPARALAAGYPTAGLAVIDLPDGAWSGLGPGCGRLVRFRTGRGPAWR